MDRLLPPNVLARRGAAAVLAASLLAACGGAATGPPAASVSVTERPSAGIATAPATATGTPSAPAPTVPPTQAPATIAASPSSAPSAGPPQGPVRIAYLHHSTGEAIWNGGVPAFIDAWNAGHDADYRITSITYPDTAGGYPWDNYPYDYWNLWVDHAGTDRDRGEQNLDDLAGSYEVVILKHCFPGSEIGPDSDLDPPAVASPVRTLANYRLQYEALRDRLHAFPATTFLVWTIPALPSRATTPDQARRAREFATWVVDSWDRPGDNIFVWDFRKLETDGGLYLLPSAAVAPDDPHPNERFSTEVAPLLGQRIVDVIEGRGDTGSVTGQ